MKIKSTLCGISVEAIEKREVIINMPDKIISASNTYIKDLYSLKNQYTNDQLYVLNNFKMFELPENIETKYLELLNENVYLFPGDEVNIKKLICTNVLTSLLRNKNINNLYFRNRYLYKGIEFDSLYGITMFVDNKPRRIVFTVLVDYQNDIQGKINKLSKITKPSDFPIIVVSTNTRKQYNFKNFEVISVDLKSNNLPYKILNKVTDLPNYKFII